MVSRAVAVVFLVLMAGGCGEHARGFVEPMKVKGTSAIEFRFAKPPASRGPALGPDHVFFFDRRHGFTATTGGGGYQQHVGYQLPTEPGRIQRTDDGGRTWRTLWSGRNVVFQSIAFANRRTGLAVASALNLKHYPEGHGGYPPYRTLLLKTSDGGRTWRASPPVFGPRFWARYSDPTIPDEHGVQLAGATTWYAFGRETRRTRDGGRSWNKVLMPRGTTLLDFASDGVGYAAATGSGCRGQELWKTVDGARTWLPITGTCVGSYMSIDFLDDRRGFISAGPPPADYSYKRPQLIIRATRDGGVTWETRYTDRSRHVGRDDAHWPAPTRLHFVDEREGWAVSHEISQGMTFDDLHVTHDGGRHWQRRWFPAWELPSAFVSGGRAWAANRWTTDWGRTWRMSVRPRQTSPSRLRLATRTRLVVETGQGVIDSRDAGRTWTTRPPIKEREAAQAMALPAYFQSTGAIEGDAGFAVRADGRRLHVPERLFTGAVAFQDDRHGLLASGDPTDARVPIYATRDGGSSWRKLKLPQGVAEDAEARIGPGLGVIVSGYPNLLVTTDEGRHWGTIELKDDFWECGAQKVGEGPYLLMCTLDVSRGNMVLFRSDHGRSWEKRLGPTQLDPNLIAVGPHEAWTIGAGALWHTTDAGNSWQEVWPSLPPDSRDYGVQHYRFDY